MNLADRPPRRTGRQAALGGWKLRVVVRAELPQIKLGTPARSGPVLVRPREEVLAVGKRDLAVACADDEPGSRGVVLGHGVAELRHGRTSVRIERGAVAISFWTAGLSLDRGALVARIVSYSPPMDGHEGLDQLEQYLRSTEIVSPGVALSVGNGEPTGGHPDKQSLVLAGGVRVLAKPGHDDFEATVRREAAGWQVAKHLGFTRPSGSDGAAGCAQAVDRVRGCAQLADHVAGREAVAHGSGSTPGGRGLAGGSVRCGRGARRSRWQQLVRCSRSLDRSPGPLAACRYWKRLRPWGQLRQFKLLPASPGRSAARACAGGRSTPVRELALGTRSITGPGRSRPDPRACKTAGRGACAANWVVVLAGPIRTGVDCYGSTRRFG